MTTTPAIELSEVSKSFGGVVAVDGITADIADGSITGIIGPNGAGKTTLLNLVTGYQKPTRGSIVVKGVEVTGRRPHDVNAVGVARTYQNLLLLDSETVFQNILIGRHRQYRRPLRDFARSRPPGSKDKTVERLIGELGLADVAGSEVAQLPYGIRRRVEIARALAGEPNLLILDEPTAGMTRTESDDIGELIRDVKTQGVTVVLVEHNVRLVRELCDEVVVLEWGRLIARDRADRIWDHETVRRAYLGQASEEVTDGNPPG